MIVELSSARGPVECEIAVKKLYKSLESEYGNFEIISCTESSFKGGWLSVVFETESDLSLLEGSIQWICKSPVRPNHKRKNWFIQLSIVEQKVPSVRDVLNRWAEELTEFDENDIKFESFHSGGNGGQNVNKVETGIRAIHIPSGIIVESTNERTQYLNKRDCIEKIESILKERIKSNNDEQLKDLWKGHNNIERGNPIRVYEGENFKRRR